MLDVLCLGLVNVNLMVGPIDSELLSRDVTLIGPVLTIPGGDATNESVVLQRLGSRVGLCGMIGQDDFGAVIRKRLTEEGVNLDALRIDPEAQTSACAVLFQQSGARNFASFRGANERFSLERFDLGVLDNVRLLSIGSMFAMKALDGEPMAELLMAARARGARTAADMKADTYGLGYAGIRCTMPQLDDFLPSYDEAKYLTGLDDVREMAKVFLGDGARRVVIKLGERGCYVDDGSEAMFVPGFRVTAVDTTGAGDNFIAGYLHGVTRGLSARECALLGNATGAASVGAVGATSAVRGLQDVLMVLCQTEAGQSLARTLGGI